MSELFLTHGRFVNVTVSIWTDDYRGMSGIVNVPDRARECGRCGALVLNTNRHTDWHASVDTAATTQLRGTK